MGRMALARTYEPNPMLRVLYSSFFDNIQVSEQWVREVRELAQTGRVVYILRSLNVIDFLALDHLTKRYDLPRIRFANDLHLGPLNPMRSGVFGAFKRGSGKQVQLADALGDGGSAALFLKRPPGVIDVAAGATGGRGLQEGDEHIRALMTMQATSDKPILLVPQVILWSKGPDTYGTQLVDIVLGPREWPNALRTAGQLLSNYKHVELRSGEPLDLRDYLAHNEGTDGKRVRRIIYIMLRRLERERRAALGPAHKPPDRQRHQILRSPKLQHIIGGMAGEKPEDRHALTNQTLDALRQMQATPNGAAVKSFEVMLDYIFHRIYAGIDVDLEGLEVLRERGKEGTLVLLPCHKSYVDFLILSFIFNDQNLQLPLIAAGDNLSFFPFGPLARRAGAFFIRRSFRGDKLYTATLEAYVRRILRDGHSIEVFLEGGRSRTGKLRKPMLGLLNMLVDATLSIPNKQVHFIPISIGYERIIEGAAYERELGGGEKSKEDATALLKSTEVLRHRYGRINVQFGHPLTLGDIREELDLPLDGELRPAKRRAVVTRLGNRTMDEINKVTAVTPGALTAIALMSDRRRSVAHEELIERCRRLLRVLTEAGARVTARTAVSGVLREQAIAEVIEMFVEGGLLEAHTTDRLGGSERRHHRTGAGVLYRIPERKRLELDTTKNHIIHFFVERSLIAIAALMPPGMPASMQSVHDRVQQLSRIFKHEFRFRADKPFDAILDETIETMIAAGELTRSGDTIDLGAGRDGWTAHVWLRTYASILRSYVEGYRVAARSLSNLIKGPIAEKDLVKKALTVGNRMFLSGDVELRESVCKPILENALQSFREEGYLVVSEGKFGLTDSFASESAVSAIEGRLAGYLDMTRE